MKSNKAKRQSIERAEALRQPASRVATMPVERTSLKNGRTKIGQTSWEDRQNGAWKPDSLTTLIVNDESSETELNLDEAWLQTLYNTAQIGIYIVANGKFRYVNPRFQSLTGYCREELLGNSPLDLVHPEDREQVRSNAIHMLKGERATPYEYRVRAKNKKILWIMETVVPISFQGMKATLGNFMDITEHKQTEELMRAHARRIETIQQVSRTLVGSLDLKSVSQATLDAMLKAAELDAGAIWLVNKDVKEVVLLADQGLPPDIAQEIYHRPNIKLDRGLIGKVVRAGELITFEECPENVRNLYPSVAKSGYRCFVGLPLKIEDKLVGVLTAASSRQLILTQEDVETLSSLGNIGAMAIANANLFSQIRKGRENWQQTFDSITDLVCIIDQDSRLVRVNKAFANAFDKSYQELIGKHCYEVVHGTKCPVPNCPHQKTLSTEGPATEELFDPDKGIYFEICTSPLTDEKNQVVGSVHVARDITERKQIQQQLIISDRLASIGELASGIAHEINNPLTSVIAFSQLLLRRELPEDVKEDLTIVESGAQRAAKIIKELLTMARSRPSVKQASQINDLIDDMLRLRAYALKQNSIEVCKKYTPDLPQVMVDCSQMQQVFLNIIMNAEYFMTQTNKKGVLTITTETVGNSIRVSFADDGPGIPKEHMDQLFNAFFTTKAADKGTGLGLSICLRIVSDHGGRIYAREGLTKGATFIIELPLATSPTCSICDTGKVNIDTKAIRPDKDQTDKDVTRSEPVFTAGFPTRTAINSRTFNHVTKTH